MSEHAKTVSEPLKLSASLIPRYVMLMRTKSDPQGLHDKLVEQIAKDMPFLPKAKIAELVERNNPNPTMSQLHGAVVVQDSLGHGQTYLLQKFTGMKTERVESFRVLACENGHEECGEGDIDDTVANARMNSMRMQFDPQWKGTRELPAFEWEGEGVESLAAALEKAGYTSDFTQLSPESDLNAPVVTAGVPSVKARDPKTRAALVKRYGEDKVAALEKNVKDKGINL